MRCLMHSTTCNRTYNRTRWWRAAGMLLVVAACRASDIDVANGADPLEALTVAAPTAKYQHEFWLAQAERRTVLWDSAYAYCAAYWRHEDGSRPNCGHVKTADAWQPRRREPRRADQSVGGNALRP